MLVTTNLVFSIFSSTSKMAEEEIRENTPEIPDGENGELEEVSFYIEDVNGTSLMRNTTRST